MLNVSFPSDLTVAKNIPASQSITTATVHVHARVTDVANMMMREARDATETAISSSHHKSGSFRIKKLFHLIHNTFHFFYQNFVKTFAKPEPNLIGSVESVRWAFKCLGFHYLFKLPLQTCFRFISEEIKKILQFLLLTQSRCFLFFQFSSLKLFQSKLQKWNRHEHDLFLWVETFIEKNLFLLP